MSPVSYSCGGVSSFVSLKGLLTLAALGIALYFGWPIIEAILILLPIPDPKDVLDKIKSLIGGSRNPSPTKGGKKGGPTYTGNFKEAPETLGESDEDQDDDIGKQPNLTKRTKKDKKKQALSYGDSDEDEERDGA